MLTVPIARSRALSSSFGIQVVDPLAPGAPMLEWISDSSDDTPEFDVTAGSGTFAEDDVITLYVDDVAQTPHVVTAGEEGEATLSLALGALADGIYNIRAKHIRDGHVSAFSNLEIVTISLVVPGSTDFSIDGNPFIGAI